MAAMDADFQFLISNVQRYIVLSDSEKAILMAYFKKRSIAGGKFLLLEGDVCKFETFITKGCLKAYQTNDAGEEHILDFLIEGWWADDLFSFFTQTPSKSSIKAIEDTEVLQISKTDLETLYTRIPQFERFFRLLFQNAYIAQRNQINQILSATAEERYLQFLKQKPYAQERFSQKDIASYLGVTPQFLSVLKKKVAD